MCSLFRSSAVECYDTELPFLVCTTTWLDWFSNVIIFSSIHVILSSQPPPFFSQMKPCMCTVVLFWFASWSVENRVFTSRYWLGPILAKKHWLVFQKIISFDIAEMLILLQWENNIYVVEFTKFEGWSESSGGTPAFLYEILLILWHQYHDCHVHYSQIMMKHQEKLSSSLWTAKDTAVTSTTCSCVHVSVLLLIYKTFMYTCESHFVPSHLSMLAHAWCTVHFVLYEFWSTCTINSAQFGARGLCVHCDNLLINIHSLLSAMKARVEDERQIEVCVCVCVSVWWSSHRSCFSVLMMCVELECAIHGTDYCYNIVLSNVNVLF